MDTRDKLLALSSASQHEHRFVHECRDAQVADSSPHMAVTDTRAPSATAVWGRPTSKQMGSEWYCK